MITIKTNENKNNNLNNLQLLSNRNNSTKNGCSSKYYGVSRCKEKFCAAIHHNKKTIHLGSFENEYEAHLRVLSYMKKHNIKRTF